MVWFENIVNHGLENKYGLKTCCTQTLIYASADGALALGPQFLRAQRKIVVLN